MQNGYPGISYRYKLSVPKGTFCTYKSSTDLCSHRNIPSLRQPVVLLQRLAEPTVRQRDDFVIVDALHRLRREHGVDHSLFGRLNSRQKNGIERIIRQHAELVHSLRSDRARIGGREGDEDIARAISGIAAVTAQAERDFFRDALQLRGDQWRVGGHYHDDGANVPVPDRVLGNFAAHVDARDAQLLARSVVALHQYADGVTSSFGVEHARRGADAALELVADHPRAPADIALFDRTEVSRIERVERVFRFHMESIDVVEVAVPRLGDD